MFLVSFQTILAVTERWKEKVLSTRRDREKQKIILLAHTSVIITILIPVRVKIRIRRMMPLQNLEDAKKLTLPRRHIGKYRVDAANRGQELSVLRAQEMKAFWLFSPVQLLVLLKSYFAPEMYRVDFLNFWSYLQEVTLSKRKSPFCMRVGPRTSPPGEGRKGGRGRGDGGVTPRTLTMLSRSHM